MRSKKALQHSRIDGDTSDLKQDQPESPAEHRQRPFCARATSAKGCRAGPPPLTLSILTLTPIPILILYNYIVQATMLKATD